MEFHTFIQENRKTQFGTAIEFFNGLAKTLDISYDYYVKIEKGKKLPRADKALQIAQALKITNLKKYFYLYAKSMMPTPETKRLFAYSEEDSSSQTPDVENLLWKYKSQLQYHLSDTQMEAVAESFESYRLFSILLYNDLAVTANELSNISNKTEAFVISKLKPLLDCGVVVRSDENQKYAVVSRYIKYPDTEAYNKLKTVLDEYDERLLKEGQLIHSRYIIKKTSAKKLNEILQRLDETERFVQAIEEDDETKNNRLIFFVNQVIENEGLLAKSDVTSDRPTEKQPEPREPELQV
ncbi:helix-turn-helix domain-containing protein [Bdellovibrionota bacterium]